ncbi:MAG: iron ABC transporter permease [Acidimicrobiia bacterium]
MDKYCYGATINRWLKYGSTFVLIFFIGLFFLWPLSKIIYETFDRSTFKNEVSSGKFLKIFTVTFFQATLSTVFTLLLGIFPTYLISKWNFKLRKIISALIVVPFVLPSVVVGASFLKILPENLHNTLIAVIAVHIFFNIAVIVKIVGATWEKIPNDLPDSSLTLGASKVKSFIYVTLPLLIPSVIFACSIVFIFCFTSYGAILIVGGIKNSTLEVEIARQALTFGDVATSSVLSIIQIIFLSIVIVVSNIISNKNKHLFNAIDTQRRELTTNRHRVLALLGSISIFLFVLVPIITLFISSIKYGNKFSFFAWKHLQPYEVRPGITNGISSITSLITSLKITLIALCLSIFIGLLATLIIYKTKFMSKIVEPLYMLPLGVSAVTLGLGILITFSSSPFNWRSNWIFIPISHSLIAIPFFIRTMLPALNAKSKDLSNASFTLGASPIRSIWEIDLKRTKNAFSKSIGFCAAISLGEFGATSLLTKTGNDTAPVAIAKLLSRPGELSSLQAYMLSSVLALVIGSIVFLVEVRNA